MSLVLRGSRSGSRRSFLVAALVMVPLLAACPDVSGIFLELGADEVVLTRGGQVEVEVELSRVGGGNAEVTLDIAGLPANVTASFAPDKLSGGTSTSTITLVAASGAVSGTYTLTVTAAGGGLTDSVELELEVVGVTVVGTIVGANDRPIAGLSVESQGETDVTDSDGGFTLVDLALPYDLTVWNSVDEWVHAYQGLTHHNPTITPVYSFFGGSSGTPRGTTVSGTLSGDAIPPSANQVVWVCVEGLAGFVFGCDSVDPAESTYSIQAQWFDVEAIDVRLHALHLEFLPSGIPGSYPGYASQAATLQHAVNADVPLIFGEELETETVTISSDPEGPEFFFGAIDLGPNLTIPLFNYLVGDTSLDVSVPDLPDTTSSFVAGSSSPVRFGWQAGVPPVPAEHPIKVPDETELISPADFATGVTTTTVFSAGGGAEGPLTFLWQADGGARNFALTTMEREVTIPDAAGIGLALPTSADYEWQVVSSGGTSVEDGLSVIADYYRVLALAGGSSGLEGSGSFSLGVAREFSTAP